MRVSRSVMSSSLQPHGLQLTRLLCPWDSPGRNTGVSSCPLLQGIFLIQGSDPHLLHHRQILYCLSHQGSHMTQQSYFWAYTLKVKVKSKSEVAQSCPTLCDPMDCSLPGSSVHGIFQARVLEWGAISFSGGSSRPRDQTWVFHIVGRRFTV